MALTWSDSNQMAAFRKALGAPENDGIRPLIDDGARERALDKIAAMRTRMETARDVGKALSREMHQIERELGCTEKEKDLGAPSPASVLGRLATVRLARYRAGSDKVSAEEDRLEARRLLLEGALLDVVRQTRITGNAIVGTYNEYQQAVARFERAYPEDLGPHMFAPDILQPVPR